MNQQILRKDKYLNKMSVKENLNEIIERIEDAKVRSGRVDDVHLLAVTKTIDYALIDESIESGIRHIGENKVQDLLKRIDHYGDSLKYHFIGGLQRNKVKDIIGKAYLIHSVDSKRLADEIQKRSESEDLVQDILIQVNVSKEETKSGVYLEELDEFVYNILELSNVKIRGLMTMAPYEAEEKELRQIFSKLKNAFDKIKNQNYNEVSMDYLSMGMTGDYEIAIEEGANIVRIGSGIYGERNY